MYKKYVKRALDILFSLCLLILLSPVMSIIAAMIRLKLGKPVIFCQPRPGKGEKIFKIYKFRSMVDKRDESGQLMSDEFRLTEFGKFLRASSLDELPELVNILRGDMSFVGPRPLLVEYLPLYNSEQRHRHDIRPGLTGLAQINGRNALTWEKKFEYDVYYVRNSSFFMDAAIIFKTFKNVVQRKDIHSPTSSTMEKFRG